MQLRIQHFARSVFKLCDVMNSDEQDQHALRTFVKNNLIDEISINMQPQSKLINDKETVQTIFQRRNINLYYNSGTYSQRFSKLLMMPVKKIIIDYGSQQVQDMLEIKIDLPNENSKLEELVFKQLIINHSQNLKQSIYKTIDLALINLIRLEIQVNQTMPIFETKNDFKFKRLKELQIMERTESLNSIDIIKSLILQSFETLESFEYIRSNNCLKNILKQYQAYKYERLLQFLNEKKIKNLAYDWICSLTSQQNP
eukprot:403352611